ncbi:MAG: dienelactone hydrolase family protein [Pirellulales bacterium]|nr:dienelactone hydrolase family protein [Pirellulales bacterium]
MNALRTGSPILNACLLLVTLTLFAPRESRAVETGFLSRSYQDAEGVEHKYVVFVPAAYDGNTPFPLIIFLHGAGERGTDNEKQVAVGLGPVVRKQAATFPAIVLFPQAEKSWMAGSPDLQRAAAELDRVEQDYRVDLTRVYATGLSMGGRGTWDLVASHPDRFAAAALICGFYNFDTIEPLAKIPTWFFHGDSDPVVPVRNSRQAHEKLKALNAAVQYTEYPGVKHDSWLQAYDTAELYTWLFAQRRGAAN